MTGEIGNQLILNFVSELVSYLLRVRKSSSHATKQDLVTPVLFSQGGTHGECFSLVLVS